MHTDPTTNSPLDALLGDRRASFSLGASGALAEFHWCDDDTLERGDGARGTATGRGAIAIDTAMIAALRARSANDRHGAGAMTYWMPQAHARVGARRVLAEIGPDVAAVREADRCAVLFDMGLGIDHVAACVRTADAALIATLRTHTGSNLLAGPSAATSAAMAAIKAASPHRVFRTQVARIEVFQPIPSRARGERTPDGPHTHVLPALLARRGPCDDGGPPGHCPVLTVYA